jgi:hypothetical protein
MTQPTPVPQTPHARVAHHLAQVVRHAAHAHHHAHHRAAAAYAEGAAPPEPAGLSSRDAAPTGGAA